ncbi:MAG: nuclear transport factor 2 family protein [Synergistaceae bacterium]|nr:nuclear transport factor 2 family protein [Synergistaceae bacterium]MBR0168661.1 nuclear transport factor 2 family protein [Synergistaceae bacterium]
MFYHIDFLSVAKDVVHLERIFDDSFVLIHMTGMKQTKGEYLKAIENGTLNYFSEELEHINVQVFNEDNAVLTGQSRVNAGMNPANMPLFTKVKRSNPYGKFELISPSFYDEINLSQFVDFVKTCSYCETSEWKYVPKLQSSAARALQQLQQLQPFMAGLFNISSLLMYNNI